jgi:hypothetical protein
MLYLAQVIHLSGTDPQQPVWDTLIGLLNKDTSAVTARLRLYSEADGSLVIWPDTGLDHEDIILKPSSSFAATFIPGNGFANPAQNFHGHATIECFRQGPFGPIDLTSSTFIWSMVSGGNWDDKQPSAYVPTRKSLGLLTDWLLAYAIPNFEDANHSGQNAYATGLSIQNFSNFAVDAKITYTVNQAYAEHGQSWSFKKHIPANGGVRLDMFTELQAVGYPATLNSEGHIEISSPSAQLYPSAIVATKDYVFSAGESFAE